MEKSTISKCISCCNCRISIAMLDYRSGCHSYCCLGWWSKHCSESQALLVWYETGKTCRVFVAKWRKQPIGVHGYGGFISRRNLGQIRLLQMNDMLSNKNAVRAYQSGTKMPTKTPQMLSNPHQNRWKTHSWNKHQILPGSWSWPTSLVSQLWDPHLCVPLWSCGAHLTVKHIIILAKVHPPKGYKWVR